MSDVNTDLNAKSDANDENAVSEVNDENAGLNAEPLESDVRTDGHCEIQHDAV